MKTISEYKDEFIKLMQELEKEHGCVVKSVKVEKDFTLYSGVGNLITTTCKIDIQ